MIESIKKNSQNSLFFLAVFFIFFCGINLIPLWSGDEGRYGEVAREMWESKDFVVPQFNYIDILEKPILAPFLTSLSVGLFGENALAARFPSIFSALAGLWMLFFFTKKMFDEAAARWSVLILSATVGYVLMGRTAMIDMLMTFCLSLSLFSLMMAVIENKKNYYYLAYIGMGLGLITKGLIGLVLPAAVYLSYLILTQNLRELFEAKIFRGFLIICLIFVPWGIAISIREPEFSYVFFAQHQLQRFSTGSFGRHRPFWFFIPIFLSLTFPWSFFIPFSIRNVFSKQNIQNRNKCIFLLLWTVVILVFFSIPKSKLPYYILPTSVPVAILMGLSVARKIQEQGACAVARDKVFETSWKILCALSVIAMVGLNVYLFFGAKDERLLALQSVIHWVLAVILFFGVLAWHFEKLKKYEYFFIAIAGAVYSFLIGCVVSMALLTPFLSTDAYARFLAPQLTDKDIVSVYASPDHFSDLAFHLKRRIMVVGSDRGTLNEESRDEDDLDEKQKWFMDNAEYSRLFNSNKVRVFCLTDTKHYDELVRSGLENIQVLKTGYGKILISNRS